MTYRIVAIYGRPNCSWCDRAKELCQQAGYHFHYIDILKHADQRDVLRERMPVELRSVPQIFLGARYLGGVENFKLAHERGEVQQFIGGQ